MEAFQSMVRVIKFSSCILLVAKFCVLVATGTLYACCIGTWTAYDTESFGVYRLGMQLSREAVEKEKERPESTQEDERNNSKATCVESSKQAVSQVSGLRYYYNLANYLREQKKLMEISICLSRMFNDIAFH